MRGTSTIGSSEIALADAWRAIVGPSAFRTDYPLYVREPNLNLVQGVALRSFEEDFSSAAGHELFGNGNTPPKFCAAYSSSALCANSFAIYRSDPSALRLLERSGFDSLRFEAPCDTDLTRNHPFRTPPTLDALLQSSETLVGIESKCIEYLREKKQSKPWFSNSYGQIEDQLEGGWVALYNLLKSEPSRFKFLDAAQLVKHVFGLRACAFEKEKILLYLYWQPANHALFKEFDRHRRELVEVAELVKVSVLKFEHCSYPEMWAQWERDASLGSPIQNHVARLKARYEVNL